MTPTRAAVVAIIAAASTASVAAAAAPRFPRTIYPPAASFPRWGGSGGWASLDGLRPVSASATRAALPLLARFQRVSEYEDLRLSDRANWPLVRQTWTRGQLKPQPIRPLRLADLYGAPG